MHLSRLLSTSLLLALLSGPLPGCREQARYDMRGPFAVGTREEVIQGGPPLPATLWYPAANPGHAREEIIYQSATEGLGPAGQAGPILGRALANAPLEPAAGACPLVIFAPDRSKGRMLYAGLLERWAALGLVVLASGAEDGSAPDPRQVRRAFALAEGLNAEDQELAGRIDTGRTVLAGHGEGAVAALAAAGQATGADPRVKAVLALDPPTEAEAGVARSPVTVPALLVSGSQARAEPLYARLASDRKAALVLQGGGRDLYTITRDEVAVGMELAPLQTGAWDIPRARGVIYPLTATFLLDVLKEDPEAHHALLPGSFSRKGVRYTSTWK